MATTPHHDRDHEPTPRIAYLFTRFPVDSETFLQREIRAMRQRTDLKFDLYSIWGGATEWEGIPVNRFSLLAIPRVILLRLPAQLIRRPRALKSVLGAYLRNRPANAMNLAENLLGLAFAIDRAEEFKNRPPDLIHGVWATMPGAAARALSILTHTPYSLGAHAYDIFADGGDWIAATKLAGAQFIHNSTESAANRCVEIAGESTPTRVIRRGLDRLPPIDLDRRVGTSVKILTVGRLVPKKGFRDQLRLYRAMRDAGIELQVTLVGEGDLMPILRRDITELGLERHVTLAGKLGYPEVAALHAAADIFIFTGVIAADGDRDGLPNVIGEAMAHGACVITTPVSGTTEAIRHEQTGQVVALEDRDGWIRAVRRLTEDHAFVVETRRAARSWIENNFCAHTNAAKLAAEFRKAAATPTRE